MGKRLDMSTNMSEFVNDLAMQDQLDLVSVG